MAANKNITFGEQLQDDLINSFCDKLQSVCPYKIEALFAIQYLLITDVADLRKQVTGKNPAIQVLYDRTRSHYVLAYYNVEHKHLEFFDSLQQFSSNGTPKMVTEICVQMNKRFGHLYTKNVPDSNASESSKTSRNSNVSQNSEDSRVQSSQLSATIDRRARAGYTMYERELMRKRMMTRIPFTADTNEASNYLSAEISSDETLTAEKVEFQPPDGSILGYLKAQYHHYIGGIWKRIKDDDGDAADHVENEEVKE